MDRMAYIPAGLLALFAAWCGTLPGASSPFAWAIAGVVLVALLGPPGLLRQGARERWWVIPWVALGVLVVSRWGGFGPPLVALAALVALAGGLPCRIKAWWGSRPATDRGTVAVAGVLGAVSCWSLVQAWMEGSFRPAMPLGHHNLLAAWVVIVAPLAALGLRSPGWRRGLSLAALCLGLGALLASRSLGGVFALAAELVVTLIFVPNLKARLGLMALGFGALLSQGPRLVALWTAADSSLAARSGYWRAGWEGFLAHPWFGWGPGSVPKTLGLWLEPVPGVNPPSEVVGQLHSLPLQLLYELGGVGFVAVLGLIGAFGWRRLRARKRATDPPLQAAGLVALVGGMVVSCTDAWLSILALPLALSVAAGGALAGEGRLDGPLPAGSRRSLGWWSTLALQVVVVLAIVSGFLGRFHYQRALGAVTSEELCRELSVALRFEPNHPLYLARRGACGEGEAGLARRAAELAPGIAVFQTSAGLEAWKHQQPYEEWLRRGLAADPLGAAAPYFLMALRPEASDAAVCGARALLSEPRLFAATFFEDHPELIAPIRREILRWPGVDAGWKGALAEVLARPLATHGPTGTFGLGFDDPQGGLSLYAFNRPSWAWEWFAVPVRVARFEDLELPSAAELATSSPVAFPKDDCGP